MKVVVLISCVSKKENAKLEAQRLYISPLFRYNLKYAKSINADDIFILSAKYGLIGTNDVIEPYDETLNSKSVREQKEWAEKVLNTLLNKCNLQEDKIIFLAGEKYRRFLIPFIINYEVPFKGLGIGKKLKKLKELTSDE